jgi:hypothetical protein
VTAAAQDPFADVPNEPRPEEYHHWDAEAVAGFQGALDEALRNGEGIWGTPFVVATALPRADHTAIRSRRSTPTNGTSTSF